MVVFEEAVDFIVVLTVEVFYQPVIYTLFLPVSPI